MYIVIYKNDKKSSLIRKKTFDEINNLPNLEEKLIFSLPESGCELYTENGIWFYENKEKSRFVIPDKYEFIDIIFDGYLKNNRQGYIFSFEDLQLKIKRSISSQRENIETAIDFVMKEITFANNFNSWDEYMEYKLALSYKLECENLKNENELLKKQIAELTIQNPK